MRFNKLILGAALAVPMFAASCNSTQYTEVIISATDSSILNCGYNTVDFKLSDHFTNQGIQFADTLNKDDFEFLKNTKLTGKKFNSIERINDYTARATFSGDIPSLTENSTEKFNVKPAAFKSTKSNIKVSSASAETSLMKAFYSKTNSTSYYIEDTGTEYDKSWYIIGEFNTKIAPALANSMLDKEISLDSSTHKTDNINTGAKIWLTEEGDTLTIELYSFNLTDESKNASFTLPNSYFVGLSSKANVEFTVNTLISPSFVDAYFVVTQ